MPIEMRSFARQRLTPEQEREVARVGALAEHLRQELVQREIALNQAHVVGAQSAAIQAIVSQLLKDELGFGEEVVLTPQDGIVTRARPDFVFPLGPGRGVMAEVERGGTVNNNHDLKDMWKAHIADDIQHLFLIVPNSNWKTDGKPRRSRIPECSTGSAPSSATNGAKSTSCQPTSMATGCSTSKLQFSYDPTT